MNFNDVIPFVKDKICMVTGGGGSIGSELVRRLAELDAKKIIIVDIYENGAYDVACEVGDKAVVEIASVRDYDKMNFIMAQYCPNVVFHAAAHKHVPFMENNPEEAVKNNIMGTEIIAGLADRYGVDNFIFISTDKAVEPVSIMGASKCIGEMLVYEKSLEAEHTKFTSVRFGNVLNSNGSVIPLFRRQTQTGKLTVTDKEVTRYFMSIEQAVELVLKSLVIAEGGEIFVFDMGDEVKILEVAERIIREDGKEPYKDVEIEFTGLRQGDKLHEKLFYDFEIAEETKYENILRVNGSCTDGLMAKIGELYTMAGDTDRKGIRKKIFEIVE